ncbi:MAG: hypothetical protein H7251_17025 [Acetobacteraceae bacterium]|nr:hypothetical protein [Acetobacteraceae bacterium]
MHVFNRQLFAVLVAAGVYLSAGRTSALALTLPASGVDTRAIAAGHYHGYDDGFGETAVTYSGTQTSGAGSDSQTGGVGALGLPVLYTGSYSASASLYDGKLRAMAAGSSITQGASNYLSFSRASASLQDTVFLTLPPGYESPPGFAGYIPVTAMIHLTGTSVPLSPAFQNDVLVQLKFDAFGVQNGIHTTGLIQYTKSDNAAHSLPTHIGFTDFGGNNYGWKILVPNEGVRALNFQLLLSVIGNGGIVDYLIPPPSPSCCPAM